MWRMWLYIRYNLARRYFSSAHSVFGATIRHTLSIFFCFAGSFRCGVCATLRLIVRVRFLTETQAASNPHAAASLMRHKSTLGKAQSELLFGLPALVSVGAP